jgi:hypothetical protein
MRFASQSLTVIMSRPPVWPCASSGWILAKNSALSLMSSIHFVWMPVSLENWATVPFLPGST